MQVDSNTQFINQLNWHSNQSTQALGRLASGSHILAPQDDAAGLAVATRMRAQLSQYDTAKSNLANAASFTQTQSEIRAKTSATEHRIVLFLIIA